ncbi:hypothetical protein KNO81_33575 [Paraburkholderia sediminicola]|jgi:hypothetical protein|nr:hypothetical protein [Paraburkholderia sediminicola]
MNHLLPPSVPPEHESEPDVHRRSKGVGHPYRQGRRYERRNLRTLTQPEQPEALTSVPSIEPQAHATPQPVLVTRKQRQPMLEIPASANDD